MPELQEGREPALDTLYKLAEEHGYKLVKAQPRNEMVVGLSSVPLPAIKGDEYLGNNLRLDHGSCRAYWCGQRVELSRNEFLVVAALAVHRKKVFTYKQIFHIYRPGVRFAGPKGTGYEANVRSMIKRIRRAFEEANLERHPVVLCNVLQNYPSVGYQWVGE